MENYSEKSIQVLEGLEAVRKRPAMYIGSTDIKGLHHLVYEIMDNAVDEALSGFGKKINVTIHKDESISIEDFGRGIPIGMHETGKSTLEVIFTVLHAGGKFGQGGYKSSGGLHGVGAAVVNALSTSFTVTTCRDGKKYEQHFENGGIPASELTYLEDTNQTGTKIRFYPDPEIFVTTTFKFDTLAERLRESAFLFKKLQITLTDERTNVKEVYVYDDGLVSYVDYLNEGKQAIHECISFEGEQQGIEVEVALQF